MSPALSAFVRAWAEKELALARLARTPRGSLGYGRADAIAEAACRAVLRAKDKLSPEEQERLLGATGQLAEASP
jgi:hypothetical protein